MLGALLGGALEAVSLVTGIRSLALLALGLYAMSAMVLLRRARIPQLVSGGAAEAVS